MSKASSRDHHIEEWFLRARGSRFWQVQQLLQSDIGARVASRSYLSARGDHLLCRMGTLANIAYGFAENLIERAAMYA